MMRLEAWIKEALPRGKEDTKEECKGGVTRSCGKKPTPVHKTHTYLLHVTDVALDEAGPGRHCRFVSLAILAVTGP